ncbi:hypothetical protein PHYC_03638 [Phycisphaerales bacterium]|nr:hypothetical protein PHYC_03638 [Phycisphaerales bacterium]
MRRFPLLRLWQFWLAAALFLFPGGLLVLSLFAPGTPLLARFNVVIVTHPGGGLWFLHQPGFNRPFLVGYDVHGTTMIITHKADGSATVDAVVPNLRFVAAPIAFPNSPPAPGIPGARPTTPLPRGRSALVSLWFLFLIGAVPAALLARAAWKRAATPGACRSCGYALTGLPPGTPCPECGMKSSV